MNKKYILLLVALLLVGCTPVHRLVSYNDQFNVSEYLQLEDYLLTLKNYGTLPFIGFQMGEYIPSKLVRLTGYRHVNGDAAISTFVTEAHPPIGLIIDDYHNNMFNPTYRLRNIIPINSSDFFGIDMGKTTGQEITLILGEPHFFGDFEPSPGGYILSYSFEFLQLFIHTTEADVIYAVNITEPDKTNY